VFSVVQTLEAFGGAVNTAAVTGKRLLPGGKP